MPAAQTSFPIQLTRQFAVPLDIDEVFLTTAARNTYLTSPRRYPGLIAFDYEEGIHYFINKLNNAWLPLGSGGGGGGVAGPVKIILTTNGIYTIPAGFKLRQLIITPSVDSNIKVGKTLAGDEIMFIDTILASVDKPIDYTLTARTDKNVYFTGITASTAILIYMEPLDPSIVVGSSLVGLVLPTRSISSSQTITTSDYAIEVNAASADKVVTLPAASSCLGRVFSIKKTDSSGNIVTVASASLIDGNASVILSGQYMGIQVQSNGTTWSILSSML